jgi:hypothetical protein
MLFREIIAVYSVNKRKLINRPYSDENAKLLVIRTVVTVRIIHFNIQYFFILHTDCTYGFHMILNSSPGE